MFNLSVKNVKGEVLELTGNDNYTVYKIEGLTPPKVVVNQSSNTTSDGGSINSVRLDSRNIVIYATINGDVEANRIQLYRYFPPKQTVSISFKNGSRDVYIEGVVEIIECDLFSNREVAQISIICPKPYFKAAEKLITSFSDVSSMFEFPFSIEKAGIPFSEITTNIRKKIINAGDVPTGAIITLFAAAGDVVNPVIYDVLNQTKMKFNFTMLRSDTIVINTNVGEKSIVLIRDGVTTNAMGYLAHDSSWLSLDSGDNIFTYDTEEGGSNLQITFTTQVLYGGV